MMVIRLSTDRLYFKALSKNVTGNWNSPLFRGNPQFGCAPTAFGTGWSSWLARLLCADILVTELGMVMPQSSGARIFGYASFVLSNRRTCRIQDWTVNCQGERTWIKRAKMLGPQSQDWPYQWRIACSPIMFASATTSTFNSKVARFLFTLELECFVIFSRSRIYFYPDALRPVGALPSFLGRSDSPFVVIL